MLIWLDSTINKKAKPNENYAREVMELFTPRPRPLHREGHPGGRAGVHRLVRRPRPVRRRCRASTTTGPRPSWAARATGTGDDIPGILLEQPACAEFICRKLFRYFVSETRRAVRCADRAAGAGVPRVGLSDPGARRDDPALEPVLRPERPAAAGEVPGRVRGGHDPRARDPQADGAGRGPGRSPASGWARASMRRPASRAGMAGRAGSTRPRCWPGPTWRSACSPTTTRRSGGGATPGRWPAGTVAGRREALAGFFIDLLVAGRARAQGPPADREGRHEQEFHR